MFDSKPKSIMKIIHLYWGFFIFSCILLVLEGGNNFALNNPTSDHFCVHGNFVSSDWWQMERWLHTTDDLLIFVLLLHTTDRSFFIHWS
jgi:hypothetical protein